jgi:hypothetical protein
MLKMRISWNWLLNIYRVPWLWSGFGLMAPVIVLAGEIHPTVPAAMFGTLGRFEAQLDSTDSASEVLRRWCADRGIADPPVIRAHLSAGPARPADRATRRRLGVGVNEPVRFRHVELACGAHVLSEADNWYRPSLLTPEMNRRLDETDAPFGVVVHDLNFHRQTLGVEWLVRPARHAPSPGRTIAPPHFVLRHMAVLRADRGEPFSLVVETYTADVLTAGSPAPDGPH